MYVKAKQDSREQKAERLQEATSELLCWTFDPLPSQSKFQESQARFKGFSGPVGSGKSAALCFETLRRVYVNFGRLGLLAAPTFAMLRDSTLVSLLESLDAQDVDFEFRKSDGELTFERNTDLLLRSLDEPERLRGTNLAWFGVDELSYAREEAWLRLEARLRDPEAEELCGFGVWTPQGHDWLYKRFIHQPLKGYECVRAQPFENRFLLGNTPDYYERLETSYDPKFYRQEALGEYLNSRADRVYHVFNPAIHVMPQKYDPNKVLMWALDFNVSPMSSVLVQWNDGRLTVIDEIILERATTEEACMEFDNRYRKHAGQVEIYGDASGRNMHTTGMSDYSTLQKFLHRAGARSLRVKVPTHNPPVMSRVQRVNGLLTNALGEVRLEIDPRCQELIKDFEEVMYKPDSGVIDKTRDPRRTHASDALGYLVWELYGEKATAGERDRRLL